MLAWSDKLIENRALIIIAAAIALFVGALLILFVFRLAFGRRLRMSGGRGRQLRLGIVDAFDLDRQRQLVIVRRDNVEHLIMIGGPNDILIESEIIRAEARSEREPRVREREFRDKELKEPAPAASPVKPQIEPKLPIPPLTPEPQRPPAAAEAPTRPVPLPVQPPSRPVPPPAAASLRRTPLLRPDFKPLSPQPPSTPKPLAEPQAPAASAPPTPSPDAPPPAAASPAAPSGPPPISAPAAPSFLRWTQRTPGSTPQPKPAAPAAAASQSPAESAAPAPTPAAPATPSPPPAPMAAESTSPPPTQTPASPPPLAADQDAIDSLEEEMAKLLGRGPGKS